MKIKQLFLFAVMTLCCLGVCAETYIKEVVVSASETAADAKLPLESNGFKVVDVDLNKKAGGKYIYLGYKTTENFAEAITALMVFNGESYNKTSETLNIDHVARYSGNQTQIENSWEFHPVARYGSSNGDLNEKSGGAYLYLYYSTSKPDNCEAIKSIDVVESSSYRSGFFDALDQHYNAIDLNAGTYGSRLYLKYSTATYRAQSSALDKQFKVTDLGSHFYQINVPVGRYNSETKTTAVFDANSQAKVNLLYANGGKKELFAISANGADKFDGKATAHIYLPTKKYATIYNDSTFEPRTPDKKGIFDLYVGDAYACEVKCNKKDNNYISLLVKIDDPWDGAVFSLTGTGHVGTTTFLVQKECTADQPEANSSLNTISATQPFLYVSDDCAPGYVETYITSMQPVQSMAVWDMTKKEFIHKNTNLENSTSIELTLPTYDNQHELMALFYAPNVTLDNSTGKQDTVMCVSATPITLPAFHSITKTEQARLEQNTDESGMAAPQPVIRWGIDYPEDDDLVEADRFIISRAFEPDYSDAVSLGSYSLQDYMPYDAETDVSTVWFEYTDNSEEARFSSVEAEGDSCLADGWSFAYAEKLSTEGIKTIVSCKESTREKARDKIKDAGYTSYHYAPVVNNNMMAFGFEKTTDPNDVIRNVIVYTTTDPQSTITVGGLTYHIVNRYDGSGPENLDNSASSGAYLYYTKESADNDRKYLVDMGSNASYRNGSVMKYEPGSDYDRGSYHDLGRYSLPETKYELSESAKNLLSSYRYPNRYIYYKVQRAVVAAMTGSAGSKYEASWRVPLSTVLPTVTKVSAVASSSYEQDHKVTLRVELDNPYPWDLVGSFDKTAVETIARANNFDRRLFMWDEKASIAVHRYNPYVAEHWQGKDETENNFTISGDMVKWDEKKGCFYAEVEDVQSFPYVTYYYEAKVDATDSNYPIIESKNQYVKIDDRYAFKPKTMATVYNAEASVEEYPGIVSVKWEVAEGMCDEIIVHRKKLDSSASAQRRVVEEEVKLPSSARSYSFATNPGDVEVIGVKSKVEYHGEEYTQNVEVAGACSVFGSIAGKVQMANGAGMPGEGLKVKVTRNDYVDQATGNRITSYNVPSQEYGNMKTKGYSDEEFVKEYPVNADGTFLLDDIPYLEQGISYNVEVLGSSASFVNYTNTKGAAKVTLSSERYDYKNIDFTCNDTVRVSGTVCYEGSTVPSRYVQFKVNGTIVTDANGNPIETDQRGYFSFAVPKMDVTIQAVKDGHTFKSEGFVLGGVEAQDKTFNIQKGMDGLTLWDQTRVRLVGRIAGGSIEGGKKPGFGLGENNIGVALHLELQLEGDNTSQIVFNREDPENTTRVEEFSQEVRKSTKNATSSQDAKLQVAQTTASFQRKRIEIWPDTETGEFCVDLYPTKYKITEISAKGYSTLLSAGEGYQVLDLTNDTTVVEADTTVTDAKSSTLYSTTYNATYKKVYHTPVIVKFKQSSYNQELDYFGEKKYKSLMLDNSIVEVPCYDGGKYIFGHPVFAMSESMSTNVTSQGKQYTLKAKCYEEYYYNNDRTQKCRVAPVPYGKLSVYNGMERNSKFSEPQTMDENGELDVQIHVNNPSFTASASAGLRNLMMQVDVNGYYYSSDTIQAYVLGVKYEGEDIASIDGTKINVVDVLRDPYGHNSYAYREAGTQYTVNRSWSNTTSHKIAINVSAGVALQQYVGVMCMQGWSFQIGGNFNWNLSFLNSVESKNGSYTITLNDRVSTNSGLFEDGAMADVYIGTMSSTRITKHKALTMLDNQTYQSMAEAEKNGALKHLAQGKDEKGNNYHLVIGDILGLNNDSISGTFVYSQRHILGTLIPNLESELSQLVTVCSAKEAQELADRKKGIVYYKEPGKDVVSYAKTQYYNGEISNRPAQLQTTINAWKEVIRANEQEKVEALTGNQNSAYSIYQVYDVSNVPIEHTESSSSYYKEGTKDQPANYNFGLGMSAARSTSKAGDVETRYYSNEVPNNNGGSAPRNNNEFGYNQGVTYEQAYQQIADNHRDFTPNQIREQLNDTYTTKNFKKGGKEIPNDQASSFLVPGFYGNFSFGYNNTPTESNNATSTEVSTTGTGYVIKYDNNSYAQQKVYRAHAKNDPLASNNKWEFILDGKTRKDYADTHDFIFFETGGAKRNPWLEPDSTYFYKDAQGNRVALSTTMLKIDNPKIAVSTPVVSNVPKSERAVFTVMLTNDTEVSENSSYLKPSKFELKVDDKSNTNGVKVYMDGTPLNGSRMFLISPGSTLTKTIEVERGVGYDFENIALKFSDESASLTDMAYLNVHFLPESTPVKMSQPVNKWVMNTLSSKDEQGYYIPVEVNGFDINYDNFDHIELQYRKSTEGDNQWVNLCSYYANDSLYNIATGNKSKIKSGTISHKFYGETDPMEMNYDLRAVSFCRLGNGYVTRSSEVMSGLKDTRTPTVFGTAKPANGIFDYESVISLPFNEPIAYNYLDRVANFQVQGYVKDGNTDHSVSVQFDKEDSYAVTNVKRNLTGRSFTIDMMVQLNKKTEPTSIEDSQQLYFQDMDPVSSSGGLSFGYIPALDRLYMSCIDKEYKDGNVVFSEKLSDYNVNICSGLTHVGVSYNMPDMTTSFFIGDKTVKTCSIYDVFKDKIENGHDDEETIEKYKNTNIDVTANNYVYLGDGLEGKIADVRLWSKVLTPYEIANKYGMYLDDCEKGLIAYWPMDEGAGDIIADKINGADLTMHNCSWGTPNGLSLRLNGEPIKITNDNNEYGKFARSEAADYTLSMWMKVDDTDMQDGKNVTVFAAGSEGLDEVGCNKFWLGFKDGQLVWRSKGKDHAICNYNDIKEFWHKVTISVSQSRHMASVYLDRNLVCDFNSVEVEGLNCDVVQFGGEGFKGNIDEFAFWHLALPANYIYNNFTKSLTGREMELQIYLPFEKDSQSEQSTMFVDFSPYNMVYTSANKTAIYNMFNEGAITTLNIDRDQHAPLSSNAGISNLGFSWTSTDNELQINLNHADKEINHSYVNLVVRGVEDLAGNVMSMPQMWSVYVDRNVLVWDKKHININAKYGEATPLTVGWYNKSGRTVNYKVDTDCSWIRIDNEIGRAEPLDEDEMTFEISDGLAPGQYTGMLYLTDDNELVSPLEINVNVEAEVPDWTVVNDLDKGYTMSLVGKVYCNRAGLPVIDNDRRDIVAAFYDGNCIGKANVSVSGDNGKGAGSNLYLTIIGDINMLPKDGAEGAMIEFRLWDASTGKINVLTPSEDIYFGNNKKYGVNEAVEFNPSEMMIQEIALKEGWNWVSFNVIPTQKKGFNKIFMDKTSFSEDDRMQLVGRGFSTYSESKGQWLNSAGKTDILMGNVYQMYMHKAGKVRVLGEVITDDKRVVNIEKKNTWNMLPYLLEEAKPIKDALADYQIDKHTGAWVKGYNSFAVLTDDGWIGSLTTLRPGEGYFLYHKGEESCTIEYKNKYSISSTSEAKARVEEADIDNEPAAAVRSSECMPIIATMSPAVAAGLEMSDDDVVVAVVGGECAGVAKRVEVGDSTLYFIAANAADGDKVQFAVLHDGAVTDYTTRGLTFDANATVGTTDIPYVIDFSKDSGTSDIYDLSGRRFDNVERISGVYITNGKKILKNEK